MPMLWLKRCVCVCALRYKLIDAPCVWLRHKRNKHTLKAGTATGRARYPTKRLRKVMFVVLAAASTADKKKLLLSVSQHRHLSCATLSFDTKKASVDQFAHERCNRWESWLIDIKRIETPTCWLRLRGKVQAGDETLLGCENVDFLLCRLLI